MVFLIRIRNHFQCSHATRNSNIKKPIQRLFQSVQNTAKTFTPAKLNFANTEFAHEITPNKQKKQK